MPSSKVKDSQRPFYGEPQCLKLDQKSLRADVSEDYVMDSRMGRLDSIGGIMEAKDNMMSGGSSPTGFMSAFNNPFPGFRNYGKKFSKSLCQV